MGNEWLLQEKIVGSNWPPRIIFHPDFDQCELLHEKQEFSKFLSFHQLIIIPIGNFKWIPRDLQIQGSNSLSVL